MSTRDILPHERERERAVFLVIVLDFVVIFGFLLFGVLSQSLIMVADAMRGYLLLVPEILALILLRRIHRGRFVEYEFGTGKIEQLVNVGIGLSLCFAAAWVGLAALNHLDAQPSASAVDIAFAIFFADLNVMLNAYGVYRFVRANEAESTLILKSQIQARLVKTWSSLVVFLVVLASALLPDPTVGNFLDVMGSLFVSLLMLRTGTSMVRNGMPDLLDHSLSDDAQYAVYESLAKHFDRYDDLVGIRSRQSGKQIFVDFELGFLPKTRIDEVTLLEKDIQEDLRTILPGAHLRLVPTIASWQPPPEIRAESAYVKT